MDNQFCIALYVATRNVVRAPTEALKPLDLTHPQYLVMLVLWEWARVKPARPMVTALGARLATDSGMLSPVLKRLQAKGLIHPKRAVSTPEAAADERELYLSLNASGASFRQQAREIPAQVLMSSPLPVEELADVRDRLAKFRSSHAAA